jgi:hypothetical protein
MLTFVYELVSFKKVIVLVPYIVELKSRLKSVSEHIVEYICYNKITAFKNLIKKI